jgi:hypothetical protein
MLAHIHGATLPDFTGTRKNLSLARDGVLNSDTVRLIRSGHEHKA